MYPRHNAPLLPAVLVPIIGNRIVDPRIARYYGLPTGTRLVELDTRVWTEFPPESIEVLAAQVVSAARQARDELARSEALARIDPSGAGLSLRARNALFRAGFLEMPWLNQVSLGQLARERGVGAKTLLEWLVAGEALNQVDTEVVQETAPSRIATAETKPSPVVRRAADAIRRRRWAGAVSKTDPRLGHLLRDLEPRAATVLEAADLLAETSFDAPSARRTARRLRELQTEAGRLKRQSLEEEIGQLVATLRLTEAGRRGLELRLGLAGAPPVTLAEAGDAVGLSRERVRQLERQLASAVSRTRPWTPVLDRTLTAVADAAPARQNEIVQLLREKGLTASNFCLPSLISAAHVFDREIRFHYDERTGLVFGSSNVTALRRIEASARRLTARWGAVTVESLLAETENDDHIDGVALRLQLEAIPGLEWLDDERDWFWVRGTKRNRLLNQIVKIMAVAGTIDIGELREGAGRFHRMEGVRPPREVLARLCVQSGLYRRDGDKIVEGPNLPPWKAVLNSTIECRIAEVLFEHGPIMRRDDLERIVVDERGVNRRSFYVYLSYSPIIARYAPGVYGLRGARVTAGEVSALIPPRAKAQRLIDSGWTSDGKVWMAFRVSAGQAHSGVLSVPASLRNLLNGSCRLFSEGERPVGVLVVKGNHMWGVGPFYRRWGVEEGDYVVVTIDITAGRAIVAAGGEEILLRFQQAE